MKDLERSGGSASGMANPSRSPSAKPRGVQGRKRGILFDAQALVALTGLMAGWIAIAVVQEIKVQTFWGFHDIRLATFLGGLATGGKSGGLVMRILLLGSLAWRIP